MRILVFLLLSLQLEGPAYGLNSSTDKVQWKLFFNQMFAAEMRKESLAQADSQAAFQQNLRRYTAYTPNTFNQSIDATLQATTSAEAYRIRQFIFDNEQNYAKISEMNFAQSVPTTIQQIPAVANYLKTIEANRNRPVSPRENFFSSPEAKNLVTAMSYAAGKPNNQKVIMIMVPGYAAHAIKFGIFPEMMADINTSWGREATRPLLSEKNGIDFEYENFKTYYGKSKGGPSGFDIVGPAGWEMGNTVGSNSETAELVAKWIKELPESYRDAKIFLLGYSKGAPIVLEMLKLHPELKPRILGMVTYGGVIQGTHVARSGGKVIKDFLGKRSIAEVVDTIRAKGLKDSINSIAPFIASFDLGFLKIPAIRDIMEIYAIDSSELESQVNRLLDGREIRELLDGVDDLTPMTRTAWNLRNFNNDLVNPGTFMFNLSAVTDISSFASRSAASNVRVRNNALIAPKLKDDGKLDWKSLSLDSWFLYLSSIEGFKMAPGGLYDTQVDLQHGKTPWLDTSPLKASLQTDELAKLWGQADIKSIMQAQGITSLEQFSSKPRSQLFQATAWDNINAYDLGEFKGHHWSLFHQAFRAPADVSKEFAIWEFPRSAFMRALLQTIALYNVVQQNS